MPIPLIPIAAATIIGGIAAGFALAESALRHEEDRADRRDPFWESSDLAVNAANPFVQAAREVAEEGNVDGYEMTPPDAAGSPEPPSEPEPEPEPVAVPQSPTVAAERFLATAQRLRGGDSPRIGAMAELVITMNAVIASRRVPDSGKVSMLNRATIDLEDGLNAHQIGHLTDDVRDFLARWHPPHGGTEVVRLNDGSAVRIGQPTPPRPYVSRRSKLAQASRDDSVETWAATVRWLKENGHLPPDHRSKFS